jgi:hypothetical protein
VSRRNTKTVLAPPVPFRCDIDVAARGWDHDAWCGEFYPPDLPREWRLTYYANHFRSVLVPGRILLRAERVNLMEWHADTHDEFRFFLEISIRLIERFRSGGGAGLLRWLEPLQDRIAGLLLLGFPLRHDATLAHRLKVLGERFSVHSLTRRESRMAPLGSSVAALENLRRCWHPGLEVTTSGPSGCLGLMLRPPADLPALRRQIEAFMLYVGPAERATLGFTGSPPPLHCMQQARILVELLGG